MTIRLRTLLALVFGMVIAAVLLRSLAVERAVEKILLEDRELVDQTLRSESAISKVESLATDMETGVRGWLLTGELTFRGPYIRAARELPTALAELERASRSDPQRAASASRVRTMLTEWDHEVAAPLLAGDPSTLTPARLRALNVEGKRRMDEARNELVAQHGSLAAAHTAALATFEPRRTELRSVQYAMGALISLLLVLGALVVARMVVQPLATLVEYVRKVAGGEFVPVQVTGVTEVRALAEAASAMAAMLETERAKEQRFTALVAALAEGGDLREVSNVALRALVANTDSVGGVLWVAREKDAQLQVAASMAIDAKSLPEGGDAVAREARSSGRAMKVEMSKASVHVVRSALVDVVPVGLTVSPVVVDGEVLGVVELVGVKAHHVEAEELARSTERIALALRNALAAEKMADLVRALDERGAEAARANEALVARNSELQSQSEELAAQSEELAAQQSELAQRNNELVRASGAKSDFLANMSHELRTPLNAVIGFSELMRDQHLGPLNSRQQTAVGDVLTAGRHLLMLIDDVLDLSKIEAGKVELKIGPVKLLRPVLEACDLVSNTAERKQIEVVNDVPETAVVQGDRDKLRQVMANLLSNAVKFTPERGRVTIGCVRSETELRVTVRDTGIGIAREDLGRLFRPFSQIDSGRARQFGGTGLGLSICRRLIELMGGVIGVESERGEGAMFWFTVPVANAPAAPSGVMRAVSTDAVRSLTAPLVLVVEDEEAAGRLVEGTLARAGYAVHVARTGEEALRVMNTSRPALMVVDLGLPGMSGWALIERMRAKGADKSCPVVVLTARDLSDLERELLGASVEVVLQKGAVSASELVERVSGLCPKVPVRALRVLAIDDNETNRKVLRMALGTVGCEMLEAEDGPTGLRMARESKPAVVLLDVEMPGMNGLDVARALKADRSTADIPIIVVSAHAMVGDAERALALGCAGYVTKPFARVALFEAIDAALGHRNWRARDQSTA